jgi:DNA-binding NarL/FixJ family response regulator
MASLERSGEVALLEVAAPGSDRTIMVVADDEVAEQRLLDLLGSTYRASADRPEIVLLSFQRLSAAQQQLGRFRDPSGPRVVVVAPEASPVQVRELFGAGVDGLVLERDVEEALLPTLAAVSAGQLVLPRSRRDHVARPALSTREKQVLGLVVLGLSNQDVAAKLHVTEATVKSHLTSSFRKLGVRSRSEAAARMLDREDGLGLGILSIAGATESFEVVDA